MTDQDDTPGRRPDDPQPGESQPGASQPGASQPGASQPGESRPGEPRPEEWRARDAGNPDEGEPRAIEKRSRWPGWIWSVPIAALAIVGYLTFQQFAERGPSVVVTFPVGGNIKVGNTNVEYEGLEVGAVEGVKLNKDLKTVNVTLRFHGSMDGHLGPGTRYWVAGNDISLSNISSIKSIISGPYIGIDPHPGDTVSPVQGLAQVPVIAEPVAGTTYRLTVARLGNISRGTEIFYRDLKVGRVEDTVLDGNGAQFDITIFVNAPFDRLIRDNTRFWDDSAVRVSMAGGGPKLQMQSLPALIQGAVAFETPPDSGPIAKEGTTFPLFDGRDAAEHAPGTRTYVDYRVTFTAPAGGLSSGAAVELDGTRIGTVRETALEYDPKTGALREPVIVSIDPTRIKLAGDETWQADPKAQLNAVLQKLIDQGLRAEIGSDIPVVGGKNVTLAFVPGLGQASLGAGAIPEIPTAPASSGGIEGIMTGVNQVIAKLNAMPLDQIAENIHTATQRLAALSTSPQLQTSLKNLDEAMSNVESITHSVRGQVGPLMTELRRTADEAQATMASAHTLLASGNGALSATAPGTAGLPGTLYELSRAARSLRDLADLLDRHPEALIKGKS